MTIYAVISIMHTRSSEDNFLYFISVYCILLEYYVCVRVCVCAGVCVGVRMHARVCEDAGVCMYACVYVCMSDCVILNFISIGYI